MMELEELKRRLLAFARAKYADPPRPLICGARPRRASRHV